MVRMSNLVIFLVIFVTRIGQVTSGKSIRLEYVTFCTRIQSLQVVEQRLNKL